MLSEREKVVVALATVLVSLSTLVFVIGAPEPAEAQYGSSFMRPRVYGDVLDNVNLNGNSNATIDLDQGRYTSMQVGVRHTNAAADRIDIVAECGTSADHFYRIVSREISGGVATGSLLEDQVPVSADTNFRLTYGVEGCRRARLTISGNNANSSDRGWVEVSATPID